MSKKQMILEQIRNRKRIARITRQWLVYTLAMMSVLMAILYSKVGEGLWPAWLIDWRNLIIAILVVALIFLTLMSPVIIEANSNPRTLTGPGRYSVWRR